MPEPIVFTLKKPIVVITRDGTTVPELGATAVTIRTDVKAKDLRVLDGQTGDIAQSIALIARLGNLTVQQVDELSAPDFQALSEIVAGFMEPGQPTGHTA